MTVAELIALLRQYPDDARVVVEGYEGGYDDPIVQTRWVGVRWRAPWYEGVYSDCIAPGPHTGTVVVGRSDCTTWGEPTPPVGARREREEDA